MLYSTCQQYKVLFPTYNIIGGICSTVMITTHINPPSLSVLGRQQHYSQADTQSVNSDPAAWQSYSYLPSHQPVCVLMATLFMSMSLYPELCLHHHTRGPPMIRKGLFISIIAYRCYHRYSTHNAVAHYLLHIRLQLQCNPPEACMCTWPVGRDRPYLAL